MERIKIHTTAAFDRMSIMQKRYHEHQEALRSTSDLSRQPSNASQFEESNVSRSENTISGLCIYVIFPLVMLCHCELA